VIAAIRSTFSLTDLAAQASESNPLSHHCRQLPQPYAHRPAKESPPTDAPERSADRLIAYPCARISTNSLCNAFTDPTMLGVNCSIGMFLYRLRNSGKSRTATTPGEKPMRTSKKAATIAVLETIAEIGLRGLAEATDDARIEILEYYMTATMWTFD